MQGNTQQRSSSQSVAFIVILVFALCLRLAAAWVWQSQADREGTLFRFGDSESYWVLGQSIAEGTPYEYHSPNSKIFRVPSYPILLSTVAWIQPQRTAVMAARGLGCMLGTFCVAMIYWIARHIALRIAAPNVDAQSMRFANLSALIAALLASTYLGAIGMSIFVLSEAIFCPLMIGSLGLMYVACRGIQTSKGFLVYVLLFGSGLLSGCAILARPSWILWPAFTFLFWLYAASTGNQKAFIVRIVSSLQFTTTFCMGIVIVMMPWWIRNYQVTGHFVPTTLQVGASLYDSFHPGANGASDTGMTFTGDYAKELAKERAAREAAQQAPTAEDSLPFEIALDKRLRNAGIEWIQKNPSDAAWLSLIKFWRTWTPLPQAAQLGSGALRIAEAIGYLVIVAMAIVAIGWVLPRRSPALLFALPCIYLAVIHSVFVGSVRYRQPAVLALCVIAGIGTAWIVVKWKRTAHPPMQS